MLNDLYGKMKVIHHNCFITKEYMKENHIIYNVYNYPKG